MTSLQEIQEDLQALQTQEERIEYLMELGEELDDYPQELKTSEYKVPGCVSGVYMNIQVIDEKVSIQATSDSLIVKGFVKIFIEYFNNKTREEIQSSKELFEDFVKKNHLATSVVATRANAIGSMYAFLEEKTRE